MKQGCKKIILTVLLCLAVVPFVAAQNISFYAEVDSAKVPLDSVARLSLTIAGTQSVSQIPVPNVDGFDVKYLGPATRISIINGQTFASHTYRYALYPLKEGKFQIPAVSIDINGKTYSTKPIDMEVVPAGTSVTAPLPSTQDDLDQNVQGKIFATMTAPKQEVYIGEAVPVTIRLFVSGLSVTNIDDPKLEEIGFSVGEVTQRPVYQQIIGGARYDVLEFQVDIYPAREGELSLGKAKIGAQMLYRSKKDQRLPFDDFDSLFDSDFFDSFLSFYERRPITIESTDLAFSVLPLPEEGRPEDFSGAVGRFDFEVGVSPEEVNVGDPVTVRMKISGDNLRSVTAPTVKAEGFKLYDPQVKEEGGAKMIEQVTIPTQEGISEFPAIEFNYFNPSTKTYESILRGPFPLTVRKPAPGQELKVVGLGKAQQEVVPETFGRDILFIKEDPDTFHRIGRRLYNNKLFWLMIGLLGIGWLTAYVLYRRTHRFKTDIAYARRWRAPRKAREGVVLARQAMAQGDQTRFYETVFKTFKEYLSDKYHLPAGTTFENLREVFESKRFDKSIISMAGWIFEECDRVRFAPAQADPAKMKEILERVESVIDYLERH